MRKDVFEEIGAFDEHMKAWGGENIDLALRVRPTLGLFGVEV
jgi:polypeptide N-acetylgalactosaminyltransferase